MSLRRCSWCGRHGEVSHEDAERYGWYMDRCPCCRADLTPEQKDMFLRWASDAPEANKSPYEGE